MALNGLFCADVPLRNYSLTEKSTKAHFFDISIHNCNIVAKIKH